MMNKKTIYPIIVLIIGIALYFMKNSDSNQTINIKNLTNMALNTKINQVLIGFYNVENLFDIYNDPNTFDDDFTEEGKLKWDKIKYSDKLSNLSDVISSINSKNPPAILGFAEVENKDVLKDLIHTGNLADFPYDIIHKDNHDGRGIDVAAIYRADLFKPINIIFYPVTLPGKNKPTTRDILHIEGELSNGELIHVFYTHWSSRRKGTAETEHKRVSTSKMLRSKIDEVLNNNSETSIFILGDFNDEPSNISVSEHLVKTDFTNLTQQYEHTKSGTVNHKGDWLVFDQIIVANSVLNHSKFKLSKTDAKIHKTEENTFTHRDGNQVPSRTYGGPKYYGGISDHYPVYLNLELK